MTGRRLVALALVAGAIAPAGPAHAGCSGVRRSGPWTTIDAPAPAAAGVALLNTAAQPRVVPHPADARVMLLLDGRTIRRTADGGCTWRTSFDLATAGSATSLFRYDPGYAVTNVVVTPQRWLYAAVVSGASGTPVYPGPLYLALSKDFGATWTVADPAPAAGADGGLPLCSLVAVAATADPRTVYASCSNYSLATIFGYSEAVYVTHDSGATWHKPAGTGFPSYAYEQRAVFFGDPLDARRVWTVYTFALGSSQLYVTNDGGTTWNKGPMLYGLGMHLGGATVSHAKGKPAHLLLWSQAALTESFDGGATFRLVKPMNPAGQEGPLHGVGYDRRGALLGLSAYGIGYAGGYQERYPACTQRERLARKSGDARWQLVGGPRSSPAGEVYQLRGAGFGAAGLAALARVFPTAKDCTAGTKQRDYVLVYTG